MATEYLYGTDITHTDIINNEANAEDLAIDGDVAQCEDMYDGGTAEYVATQDTGIASYGSITEIMAEIAWRITAVPVDDDLYLEIDDGSNTWWELAAYDSVSPPPVVLGTQQYTQTTGAVDLQTIFNTLAKIDGARIRWRGVKTKGADPGHLEVDEWRLTITYVEYQPRPVAVGGMDPFQY